MLVAFVARWMVLGECAQGWWLILVKCDAENLIVVDRDARVASLMALVAIMAAYIS